MSEEFLILVPVPVSEIPPTLPIMQVSGIGEYAGLCDTIPSHDSFTTQAKNIKITMTDLVLELKNLSTVSEATIHCRRRRRTLQSGQVLPVVTMLGIYSVPADTQAQGSESV